MFLIDHSDGLIEVAGWQMMMGGMMNTEVLRRVRCLYELAGKKYRTLGRFTAMADAEVRSCTCIYKTLSSQWIEKQKTIRRISKNIC